MPIPIRTSDLNFSSRWPRWIVIHHAHELNLNSSEVQFDTPQFQSSKFKKIEFQKSNKSTYPYHFLADQVGNDYEIIVGRPMLTSMAEFEDIDPEFQQGIHIGLMGNYNDDIPNSRLYSILAFKLINPLMRLFSINVDNVVLHRDISTLKIDCPGELFVHSKLIAAIKSTTKKISISRR
jgi:hypothetical protein